MRSYRNRFTLLELLIAMGLMMILMLAIISIFSTAMDIFNKSKAKMEVYQNARTTLNMMERDLLGTMPYTTNGTSIQEFRVTVDANGRPNTPADPPDPAEIPFLAFATNTAYIDPGTPPVPPRRLIGPIYVEYVMEGGPAAFPYYQIRRKTRRLLPIPRALISEEAISQFILPLDTSGGIPGTSGQPSLKIEAITSLDTNPLNVDPSTAFVQAPFPVWHTPSVATSPFLPRALRISMDMIDPQNRECRTINSTFWIPAATQQE